MDHIELVRYHSWYLIGSILNDHNVLIKPATFFFEYNNGSYVGLGMDKRDARVWSDWEIFEADFECFYFFEGILRESKANCFTLLRSFLALRPSPMVISIFSFLSYMVILF